MVSLTAIPARVRRQGDLLTTLQAGRALAALAVVFNHLSQATRAFVGGMPDWLMSIMGHGYLGVDFFFVLSGFIIYYTNIDRVGPGWPRAYAQTRLLRIYAPYLPIGVGLAVLYVLLPGLSHGNRHWGWLTSITLLPSDRSPALSVAWTLRHEIVFYAFAFFALLSRRPLAAMGLWAGLIGVNLALGGHPGTPSSGLRSILLDPINLEFGFGMLAAWGFNRPSWRRPILSLLLSAATITVFFLLGAPRDWSVILGLGLTFLIVPLVQAERAGRFTAGPTLLLLGEASYAIYLVHDPVLSIVARVAAGLPFAHWSVCVLLGLAAAVAAGVGYHLLYEKPALRFLKRLVGGKRIVATSLKDEAASIGQMVAEQQPEVR